ncbi:MAG: hypothetical protein QOG71_1221 [Pyrinomonadaceae bacterium]|nr:hypothetical protein [Pyrinomonadaceae bacterium]
MSHDNGRDSPQESQKSLDLLHPSRSWFLAGAGAVAVYLLGRLNDVPLWLVFLTLAVLLVYGVFWPWMEATRKRATLFLGILSLYVIAASIIAVSVRPAPSQAQIEPPVVVGTPSPTSAAPSPTSATPPPTITPTPQVSISPTVAPSPSAPKPRSRRPKASQGIPCSAEDRLFGKC